MFHCGANRARRFARAANDLRMCRPAGTAAEHEKDPQVAHGSLPRRVGLRHGPCNAGPKLAYSANDLPHEIGSLIATTRRRRRRRRSGRSTVRREKIDPASDHYDQKHDYEHGTAAEFHLPPPAGPDACEPNM